MTGRRHCIDLSQFTVSNDGRYGGGSNLEHRFRDCRWQLNIDGMALPEITRKARGHATFCDGTYIPPRRAEPSVLAGQIQQMWGPAVVAALRKELRYGR